MMTIRSAAASLIIATAAWMLPVQPAAAEGRCPPGQYPIGGQGFGGCAPIPAAPSRPAPKPSGKWLETWGAISLSSATGRVGTSTGQRTEKEALVIARAECAEAGASDCTAGFSYHNQCAVLLGPAPGASVRASAMARGPTVAAATEAAMKTCGPGGGAQCVVAYYGCTQPIFVE